MNEISFNKLEAVTPRYEKIYSFEDVTEYYQQAYFQLKNRLMKGVCRVNKVNVPLGVFEKSLKVHTSQKPVADTENTKFDGCGRATRTIGDKPDPDPRPTRSKKDAFGKLEKLLVGWDMEWSSKNARENELLTIQLYFLDFGVGYILEIKDNIRLGLDDVFEFLLPHYADRVNLARLNVTLVAHYGIAEFSHLSPKFKARVVEFFGGYKNFTIRKLPANRDPVPVKCSLYKNSKAKKCVVNVFFRDTFLLSGESLSKTAKIYGVEKFDIGAGIENFKAFLETDRDRALDYAMNDAVIVTQVYGKMQYGLRDEFGITSMPMTASGLSVSYIRAKMSKEAFKNLGVSEIDGKFFDSASDEVMACRGSYHGGLNCVFNTGFWPDSSCYDYDLISAYGRVMKLLKIPNFQRVSSYKTDLNGKILNFGEVSLDDMGVIKLKFIKLVPQFQNFIPFSFDFGLVFPSYAENCDVSCLNFAYLLHNGMVEDYEIVYSKVFRECDENCYELSRVVSDLTLKRDEVKLLLRSNPDDRELLFRDRFIKLITNSLYGKFGQSLKTDVELSAVSNPAIVSYITDYCRLILIENLNELHREGYTLFSATTDGFMVREPIDAKTYQKLTRLPATSRLLSKTGTDNHLELKHSQTGGALYIFTTRGYIMAGDGAKRLIAKNGFKVPPEIDKDDPVAVSELIVDCIKNDKPNLQHHFANVDKIYEKPFLDLVDVESDVHIGFDVDLKRKIEYIGWYDGFPRFSTSLYATLNEAVAFNDAKAKYRKTLVNRGYARTNFTFKSELNVCEYLFYLDVLRVIPRYDENFFNRCLCLAMIEKGLSNTDIDAKLKKKGYAKKIRYELSRKDERRYSFNAEYPTDSDFYARHAEYLGADLLALIHEYLLSC